MSGSTRGAGTAVTAGEVPQLKVVSGRHSDTRERPVRSGYSVARRSEASEVARMRARAAAPKVWTEWVAVLLPKPKEDPTLFYRKRDIWRFSLTGSN